MGSGFERGETGGGGFTLQATPHTLNSAPTPDTLHSAPCTIHPRPYPLSRDPGWREGRQRGRGGGGLHPPPQTLVPKRAPNPETKKENPKPLSRNEIRNRRPCSGNETQDSQRNPHPEMNPETLLPKCSPPRERGVHQKSGSGTGTQNTKSCTLVSKRTPKPKT